MISQDAFIDGIGALRISAASRRQAGSPPSSPNPSAAGGAILSRRDGGKDLSIGKAAARAEERRRLRRHGLRLPLTMSVFNQGVVMPAEMVGYGQDGICAETHHRILPGTSIHLRIDTSQATDVGKAILQGLRTTALGEVKWCQARGPGLLYRIGIRYYPHY